MSRSWLTITVLASFALCSAPAADETTQALLAAATKGDTKAVQALLKRGVPIEAEGKDHRTALMLAAQHGHADTVNALLAAGAKTDARDASGLTAYGLAMFAPSGRGSHDDVLKALPHPPKLRLAVITGWSPQLVVSSCFQNREQVIQDIGMIRPDEVLLRELQAYALGFGKGVAQLVSVDAKAIEPLKPVPAGDSDALVALEIEPGSACKGGLNDNLTFAVSIQVIRTRDRALLLEKRVGGGLKNLRVETIDNRAQFRPIFESWLKQQPGSIYWAVVEALMKSTP